MNYDWNTEDEWLALNGQDERWVTGKASRLKIIKIKIQFIYFIKITFFTDN